MEVREIKARKAMALIAKNIVIKFMLQMIIQEMKIQKIRQDIMKGLKGSNF